MPAYDVKHPACGFAKTVELPGIPERFTCLGCGKDLPVTYQQLIWVAYCPGEKTDNGPS